MPSLSRIILAAGLVLASVSLAEAGDRATFSPNLADASTGLKPAPTAPEPVVAPAIPAPRPAHARRRTRVAAAAKPVAAAKAPAAEPAPAPEAEPAPARNTETAAATPGAPEPQAAGPREVASGTVGELLAKHAVANGVPLRLARAVVTIESRGNVRASNGGALGLMQIKFGTARAAGFQGPPVGLFVADTNLRFGMKVLGEAYRAAGGDTCGALMRYQSGHLASRMNAANRAYCSRAKALMARA